MSLDENEGAQGPQDYKTTFDPDAYFNHYFSKESIEDGTRVSLFALPVFAQLALQTMRPHERETLLDVGAGPTVYSALCFRDVVKRVFLSDYVDKNLDVLKDWLHETSNYDWTPTIKVIKRTEGGPPHSEAELAAVENKTRSLVKGGGILFADVHLDDVVPNLPVQQVDILVSIFTLESACQTHEQYSRCINNMMKKLRPGGKFILGSVLEDDYYNSGRQVIFTLLNLSEDFILSTLRDASIDLSSVKKYVLQDEGVMFLMATKFE